MAKSGQYMPQRSQPLHFSAATTCGGWYPVELKAEESARTWVGQNSTQNPHPLQRSTVIATWPLAMGPSWSSHVKRLHAVGHLRLLDRKPVHLIASGTIAGLQGNQFGRQAARLVHDACRGARNRRLVPVAAVDDGGGFVGLAGGETLVFAAAGPPQEGAEPFA